MLNSFALSVIVPVRNAASHLPAALASIRPQLPQSAEILVIDGGSSDDSVAIATAHGARVLHQQGRGLAAARNQAIRACNTPWISFCDADDRWTSDSLAVRMGALDMNPPASAVIGRIVRERLPGTEATPGQLEQVGRPVPGFTPGAIPSLANDGNTNTALNVVVGPFGSGAFQSTLPSWLRRETSRPK